MYYVNKHADNDGLIKKITPRQCMCAWTPLVYLFVIAGKIETYQPVFNHILNSECEV